MSQDVEAGAVNFRMVIQMYEEADDANAKSLDSVANTLDTYTELTDPMK